MGQIGDGSFMPPQFWVVLTVLFATAFMGLLLWMVRSYLEEGKKDREESKKNFEKLTDAVDILEKIVFRHEYDIENIKKATKI